MDTKVIEEVSKMLSSRTVVSEEEVRRTAIRAALRVLGFKLASADQSFIEDVTCSLIECPLTLKSLHFSEKFKVGDAVFYHVHTKKPSREELELAYEEYVKSKAYLDAMDTMCEVTDRFFDGYESSGTYLRLYRGRGEYAVFYSIIDDVYYDLQFHTKLAGEFNGEYVVVVPTEREINPFLRFFKHKSEAVKRANIKIWVVNASEKTIDPFIGYPKDFKLLKGFKNPKAASLINSLWRVNVEELD